MTSPSDFLKAIVAEPDLYAPRLIYADWLEEQGAGHTANLLRLKPMGKVVLCQMLDAPFYAGVIVCAGAGKIHLGNLDILISCSRKRCLMLPHINRMISVQMERRRRRWVCGLCLSWQRGRCVPSWPKTEHHH